MNSLRLLLLLNHYKLFSVYWSGQQLLVIIKLLTVATNCQVVGITSQEGPMSYLLYMLQMSAGPGHRALQLPLVLPGPCTLSSSSFSLLCCCSLCCRYRLHLSISIQEAQVIQTASVHIHPGQEIQEIQTASVHIHPRGPGDIDCICPHPSGAGDPGDIDCICPHPSRRPRRYRLHLSISILVSFPFFFVEVLDSRS